MYVIEDARRPSSDLAKVISAEADAISSGDKKSDGIKGLASGRQDMFRLNPYLIQVEPGWNSRELDDPTNRAHIDALALSISEVGVKEPLTGYWKDGAPVVTDGHCRLMATFIAIEKHGAEIKTIPFKTEDRYSSEADRVLSQLVRNMGKPLSPFEQGTVFKKLLGLGWSEKEVASKVGLSTARVAQIMELHSGATPEIKALVTTGQVSATFALQELREAGGDAEKAVERLSGAVETAKAEGKTRATPKHAGGGKRDSLKQVFDRAEIDNSADNGGVLVRFSAEDFDILRKLLKL